MLPGINSRKRYNCRYPCREGVMGFKISDRYKMHPNILEKSVVKIFKDAESIIAKENPESLSSVVRTLYTSKIYINKTISYTSSYVSKAASFLRSQVPDLIQKMGVATAASAVVTAIFPPAVAAGPVLVLLIRFGFYLIRHTVDERYLTNHDKEWMKKGSLRELNEDYIEWLRGLQNEAGKTFNLMFLRIQSLMASSIFTDAEGFISKHLGAGEVRPLMKLLKDDVLVKKYFSVNTAGVNKALEETYKDNISDLNCATLMFSSLPLMKYKYDLDRARNFLEINIDILAIVTDRLSEIASIQANYGNKLFSVFRAWMENNQHSGCRMRCYSIIPYPGAVGDTVFTLKNPAIPLAEPLLFNNPYCPYPVSMSSRDDNQFIYYYWTASGEKIQLMKDNKEELSETSSPTSLDDVEHVTDEGNIVRSLRNDLYSSNILIKNSIHEKKYDDETTSRLIHHKMEISSELRRRFSSVEGASPISTDVDSVGERLTRESTGAALCSEMIDYVRYVAPACRISALMPVDDDTMSEADSDSPTSSISMGAGAASRVDSEASSPDLKAITQRAMNINPYYLGRVIIHRTAFSRERTGSVDDYFQTFYDEFSPKEDADSEASRRSKLTKLVLDSNITRLNFLRNSVYQLKVSNINLYKIEKNIGNQFFTNDKHVKMDFDYYGADLFNASSPTESTSTGYSEVIKGDLKRKQIKSRMRVKHNFHKLIRLAYQNKANPRIFTKENIKDIFSKVPLFFRVMKPSDLINLAKDCGVKTVMSLFVFGDKVSLVKTFDYAFKKALSISSFKVAKSFESAAQMVAMKMGIKLIMIEVFTLISRLPQQPYIAKMLKRSDDISKPLWTKLGFSSPKAESSAFDFYNASGLISYASGAASLMYGRQTDYTRENAEIIDRRMKKMIDRIAAIEREMQLKGMVSTDGTRLHSFEIKITSCEDALNAAKDYYAYQTYQKDLYADLAILQTIMSNIRSSIIVLTAIEHKEFRDLSIRRTAELALMEKLSIHQPGKPCSIPSYLTSIGYDCGCVNVKNMGDISSSKP